ncbi:DUF3526 domain-containing protein [Paraflavitalea pollutisoli]|uniref:DUF3526 domain-containing protein n=1 Tax=Paraflavitalea pollutisoli TaxID=3034143 RepID=UPI0023EE14A9|nr:DUF3526 domain-containing protein [Paraflavitalea sp. H1-2-19X]
MLLLAFKNFIRSRSVLLGIVFLLLTGVISLLIGRQFLDRQHQHLRDVQAWQQEHVQRNVAFHDKEIGLLLYYLRFSLVNETHPLNGLSIGQRDVTPSVKSLNIRNLEAQQYDTDLYNPTNLLLGNLDFSFVLIYLFPLMIIAFTYNTLSGEKEQGTWSLLSLQAGKPGKLILQLFALRGAVLLALFIVLVALAIPILGLPLDRGLLAVVTVGILYLLFWLSASWWILSWQKSSPVNAISLLALWVLLTMVSPAMINNFLINRYPTPEALETAVEQRRGYHDKWDQDQVLAMKPFYKHYPQFAHYGVPKDRGWLWYFAAQQMGDDEAKASSDLLRKKLHSREQAGQAIAWFIPSLHVQWQLNGLAQAGLGNYLQYLDRAAIFHEANRLHYYPAIFEGRAVSSEDWKAIQVTRFTAPQYVDWLRLTLPLVLSVVLLSLLSTFNGRKQFQ